MRRVVNWTPVPHRKLEIRALPGFWPPTWPMGLTFLRLLLLPVFLWIMLAESRAADGPRWIAVSIFAVMAAVDQLGIAETVVDTLFIGLVAMVVLAAGLAFGLGGQQTAAQITAGWYASGREAGAKIAEYAQTQSQEGAAPPRSTPAPTDDQGARAASPPPSTPRTEPTGG